MIYPGWQNTASLRQPRTQHSALLLADGRVLVVGGFSAPNAPLQSCETFDPVRETWSPTGSLNSSGTVLATNLPDGRVLAIIKNSRLAVCEIFNPDTGQWTITESQPLGGVEILIPLKDGRVLGHPSRIFDPTNDKWIKNHLDGLYGDADDGICLADGRVLMILGWGGWPCDGWASKIIDLAKNSVKSVGFPYTYGIGRLLLLDDERVFYCDTEHMDNYLYDPVTNKFVRWDGIYQERAGESHGPSVLKLSSGNVLVCGGEFDPPCDKYHPCKIRIKIGVDSDICSVLHIPELVWVQGNPLNLARRHHAAVLLNDNRVLITGGETGDPAQAMANCELGHP